MSGISSVSQLVAVIQAQLAPRNAVAGRKAAGARRQAAAATYAQERLASLIGLRVAQIGRDTPQRGRKAFRVFLEAVLLSHFGDALLNDPQFFQMVDDIQTALEADEDCRKLVDSAIAHLLSE
jgi:hypothetical protein